MIDAETAQLMAANDVFPVPTLFAYKGMADMGRKLRFPERNLIKNEAVLAAGIDSLKFAQDAGVKMGLGTDLIGESQAIQREESAIRARVQSAESILHAMYVINPIILRRPEIGRLARADAITRVILRGVPIDA